uniref:Uncharacterized protein n=1 Tax=Entomoneis paludosa TaxID=265537 RepID=A0A7S2YBU5_9STRA
MSPHAQPVTVQITSAQTEALSNIEDDDQKNNHKVVVRACGTVWFSNGAHLSFSVGYVPKGRGRQECQVHSRQRYATLTDFAIGQTAKTFRVYDKQVTTNNSTKDKTTDNDDEEEEMVILGGDAVDVISGPPQNVMAWRQFAQLCRAHDAPPSKDTTGPRNKAQHMTQMALQLKTILNHLEASQRQGNVKLELKA